MPSCSASDVPYHPPHFFLSWPHSGEGIHPRLNAIAPGIINTDMNNYLSNEELESIKEEIPLERIGETIDISKCVEWLIKDNYTTGQIISINGGWVC